MFVIIAIHTIPCVYTVKKLKSRIFFYSNTKKNDSVSRIKGTY